MDYFWKALSIAFIVIIVSCLIEKNEKDIYVLLTISACIIIGFVAAHYLSPAMDLLKQLQRVGGIHWDMLTILIKATGIGFISEIMSCICIDSGNSGLGKLIQIMSTSLILSMSIPLFETLLETLQNVLG